MESNPIKPNTNTDPLAGAGALDMEKFRLTIRKKLMEIFEKTEDINDIEVVGQHR